MMRTNLNGGWGGPGGIAPGGIAPGGITPGGMEALDGDRSIPGGGGPFSIPAQMPKQWQQALKPSIQDRAGPVQHSWTDAKTQWQQALKPSIQDRAGPFSIPAYAIQWGGGGGGSLRKDNPKTNSSKSGYNDNREFIELFQRLKVLYNLIKEKQAMCKDPLTNQ